MIPIWSKSTEFLKLSRDTKQIQKVSADSLFTLMFVGGIPMMATGKVEMWVKLCKLSYSLFLKLRNQRRWSIVTDMCNIQSFIQRVDKN